jgi:hypothetical protein
VCHLNTNCFVCLYVLYVSVMHRTSKLHYKLFEGNCSIFQTLPGTTFGMDVAYSFGQAKLQLLTLQLMSVPDFTFKLLALLKFILSCFL